MPALKEIVAEGLSLAKANRPLLRTPLCGRVMHLIHATHVLGHAERLYVNGNQYWGGFGIAMRRGRGQDVVDRAKSMAF